MTNKSDDLVLIFVLSFILKRFSNIDTSIILYDLVLIDDLYNLTRFIVFGVLLLNKTKLAYSFKKSNLHFIRNSFSYINKGIKCISSFSLCSRNNAILISFSEIIPHIVDHDFCIRLNLEILNL